MAKCPTCESPKPNLHPIQHEGEVQPCADAFHDRVTAENTPEKIAVLASFRHPTVSEVEAEILRRLRRIDRLEEENVRLREALRSVAERGTLTSCTQCKAVARAARRVAEGA